MTEPKKPEKDREPPAAPTPTSARDGVEPSKDRPSGPGDTGPGSTADHAVEIDKAERDARD